MALSPSLEGIPAHLGTSLHRRVSAALDPVFRAALSRTNGVVFDLAQRRPGMVLDDRAPRGRAPDVTVTGAWRINNPAFARLLVKQHQLIVIHPPDVEAGYR